MPKILRIINRLNLGGPTYNVAYLSKYLEPKYKTLIVAGQKDDSEESSEFILKNLGLNPIYIRNMRREISPVLDWKAFNELKELIYDFKPDIVHTHAAKAGTLGRLAAIKCKVPVIVHTFHGHVFHSYFSPLKTKIFIEIERYLAKKSSAIIALSKKQKDDLTKVFKISPENKTHVIKLGFDLEKFQTNQTEKRLQFRNFYKVEENELVVTIVGRLVPIKNHHFLLKAIKKVQHQLEKNRVRFFIVGDGELKNNLIDECKKLQLPFTWYPEKAEKKLITFTSWRKDIDVVNAGSDIIVLCSHNEGTPVSLIEAQAAGKPVISSNVGGVEDVLNPQSGLLYTPGNLEEFCQKLVYLIENENVRTKMSNNSRELISNEFSYQRLVEDMDKLYQNLLRA